MIDMQTADRLAGEFVACIAEQDDLGMAAVRLVLDHFDQEDFATWRLAVYLLAMKAVRELAALHAVSPSEVIERLT
jgi:hypothetical protein